MRVLRALRRRRRLTGEVALQRGLLEQMVARLGAVSATLEPADLLDRAAAEAHALFGADAVVVFAPAGGDPVLRPVAAHGALIGPLAALAVPYSEPVSPLARAASLLRPDSALDAAGCAGDPVLARLGARSALAVPLVVQGRLHAVLALVDVGGRRLLPADLAGAGLFADFVARAAENAALFARVEALLAEARHREAERAELSRRVVSAEQDERRRLSQELHDGPLQTMSGVAMMMDALEPCLEEGDADGGARILDAARGRQRDVIRSLRALSFALEPWALRDRGFEAAVRTLADELERCHAIRITVDVAAADALGVDEQVHLYGIVREALQNAVKHAAARTIDVNVTDLGDALDVRVRDDGRGMADPTGRAPDDGLTHYGVSGMRERAAILAATLSFDTAPGAGTTVAVHVPTGLRRAA